MKTIKHILFAFSILIGCTTFSQNNQYILALSKTENKLFVLDYTSLKLITKIPVGNGPHEIVTNKDGSKAYISIPEMMSNGHQIDVINLKTLEKEKSINTKPLFIPHGLVLQNNKLWFTAQGSKAVGVINLEDDTIEQILGTGQDFTHMIHVTDNGKTFYTTNVESGTVSIYENKEIPPYMPPTGVLPPNAKPRTEWKQTLIDAGFGAEGFDVSPNGEELWTAKPDGHIIIIDLVTKTIKADINSNVQGLHRLKITPDGTTVCIVSVKTGDLLYYDINSHKLLKKVNIGQGAGIFMDKESNRMFISCTPNNKLIVIDLLTKKEITQLSIGRPDGVTSTLSN